MLRMTVRAYAIARLLVVQHGARGLRVCDGSPGDAGEPQLLIGPAGGPAADDAVVLLGDLEVYLDAVAEQVLDERVLDAEPEGEGLRWEAAPSGGDAEDDEVTAVVDPAAEDDEVEDADVDSGAAPADVGAEEDEVARLVGGWSDDLDLLARFEAYCAERDERRRAG